MEYSLVGVDSDAFCVMGYVTKALKKEGRSQQVADEYRKKAMDGDYQNLLRVSMKEINKLNLEIEEAQ